MTITRAVGAAALSVAFTAGVVAPAVAATMTNDQPRAFMPRLSVGVPATAPATSACSTLASQLATQITSIGADLTAVPPKTAALTGPVTQMLNDVLALQKAGCLPAAPGAPATLPAACAPDVAKLLADAFELGADLSALPPNVPGALSSVGGVVADVKDLVTAKCLPAVTLPTIPGLPTKPTLPSPGLPMPPLPVGTAGLPTPVLPGTPKLPAPLPTPPVSLPTGLPTSLPTPPKLPVPLPPVPTSLPTVPKLPVPLPSVPSLPSLPSQPSLPTLPSAPSLPTMPSAPGTPKA